MKIFAALSIALFLLVSCKAEQVAATSAVMAAVQAGGDPASPGGEDYTVEEREAIADALELGGIEWGQLGASVIAFLLMLYPGLRVILPMLPNRQIIGKQESDAVDRAAGIHPPRD